MRFWWLVIGVVLVGCAVRTLPVLGQTRTVSAEATDNVGVVVVRFYVDGDLIGSDVSEPYEVEWVVPGVGTYQLRAEADDAAGNTGVSAVVEYTATDLTPPVLSITVTP